MYGLYKNHIDFVVVSFDDNMENSYVLGLQILFLRLKVIEKGLRY